MNDPVNIAIETRANMFAWGQVKPKTTTNLKENESNNQGTTGSSPEQQQARNGGLLNDAQSRIKGRSRVNGKIEEQGVLSQEELDDRNQKDREALEKFAKEQGKWVEDNRCNIVGKVDKIRQELGDNYERVQTAEIQSGYIDRGVGQNI